QLDLPLLINTDQIQGEILFSDHFGNLITSLGRWTLVEQGIYRFYPWLDRGSYHSPEIITSIREAKLELPEGSSLNWVETFADIPPEECAVLVGSSGLLEIAANNAPATTRLNLSPGDPVTLFL
ncbi:MAG: SAM-dependent chlorinase/fluorinase, partial [Chloroflexota bacterium]